jgi:hypothetical protein
MKKVFVLLLSIAKLILAACDPPSEESPAPIQMPEEMQSPPMSTPELGPDSALEPEIIVCEALAKHLEAVMAIVNHGMSEGTDIDLIFFGIEVMDDLFWSEHFDCDVCSENGDVPEKYLD